MEREGGGDIQRVSFSQRGRGGRNRTGRGKRMNESIIVSYRPSSATSLSRGQVRKVAKNINFYKTLHCRDRDGRPRLLSQPVT